MQIEILALRHQLAVLQRRTKKRASLRTADRLLWVILSRVWAQWRSALVIVKPETVIAWQRFAMSEEPPESPNCSRPLSL
jgi:putative transposase